MDRFYSVVTPISSPNSQIRNDYMVKNTPFVNLVCVKTFIIIKFIPEFVSDVI